MFCYAILQEMDLCDFPTGCILVYCDEVSQNLVEDFVVPDSVLTDGALDCVVGVQDCALVGVQGCALVGVQDCALLVVALDIAQVGLILVALVQFAENVLGFVDRC
mmetsp:Transcript_79808/g.119950  ORF Transcript_79808/g.119950 Transcript_79808/m.119950 type:complete len:106 (+) Transcript_79808:430-747(+)